MAPLWFPTDDGSIARLVGPKSIDEIEDARFPEFNKIQQRSTRRAHLIETEAVENRRLLKTAVNRLLNR